MASQPHQMLQSYMIPTATTTIATDEASERTVEMDGANSPYTGRHSRQNSGSNGPVPSYMAPTHSAKAKVRSPGRSVAKPQRSPNGTQWNSFTKKGLNMGCDSSSSGGTVPTPYHGLRSPNPKLNGQHQRGPLNSPETTIMGGDEWLMPGAIGHTWRHDSG